MLIIDEQPIAPAPLLRGPAHALSRAWCNAACADRRSLQGRAFTTGETSIAGDLQNRNGCGLPPSYAAHGIVSIVDLIIKDDDDQPYGILEIGADRPPDYDRDDIHFLTGFADRPELLAITRMIDQAGARGADLTQRLLAVARKQPLQPREVDVNALVMRQPSCCVQCWASRSRST